MAVGAVWRVERCSRRSCAGVHVCTREARDQVRFVCLLCVQHVCACAHVHMCTHWHPADFETRNERVRGTVDGQNIETPDEILLDPLAPEFQSCGPTEHRRERTKKIDPRLSSRSCDNIEIGGEGGRAARRTCG